MKHITLLAAMAIAVGANAQRSVGTAEHIAAPAFNLSADRTPFDTLAGPSIGTPLTLYGVTTGGYVTGSNSYGDAAKVQVFASTGDVFVEEVAFFFGAKNDNGSPNAIVHARVYSLDGAGTASTGEVTTAPGTVEGNLDFTMSECDTSGNFTIATFNPAVAVSGNFGAGIDVGDLGAGVYIGLVSTADSAAGAIPDNTWEKWSDGTWYTLTASWPITNDMFVLAVIGDGVAGINDLATVNNMRMSFIGGNPANSSVIVAYEMLESADARMTVLDAKGAKMMDQQLGRTPAGEHQTTLDVSSYSNGTYYVTIYANGNPLTKKLVVQH